MSQPKNTSTRSKGARGTAEKFTAEERAAMRARAKELKAAADGESALREALAAMAPADHTLAERLHALITATARELTPRTWYGMPAYAGDEKVVCFFKPAAKFKTRYATLGFSDKANLDDGDLWPTEYALTKLTPTVEKQIAALVKRALS